MSIQRGLIGRILKRTQPRRRIENRDSKEDRSNNEKQKVWFWNKDCINKENKCSVKWQSIKCCVLRRKCILESKYLRAEFH